MDFMKVFIDDFSVANGRAKYLLHLRLCLQRCKDTKRNKKLNVGLEKCCKMMKKTLDKVVDVHKNT